MFIKAWGLLLSLLLSLSAVVEHALAFVGSIPAGQAVARNGYLVSDRSSRITCSEPSCFY